MKGVFMKLYEMILVTENYKGTEINSLMTFVDYKKNVLSGMSENVDEAIQAIFICAKAGEIKIIGLRFTLHQINPFQPDIAVGKNS